MSMKENKENYLEGIYGCLERIEKKVGALSMEGAKPHGWEPYLICGMDCGTEGPSGTPAIRGGEKQFGNSSGT